jgi:pantothenate kinase
MVLGMDGFHLTKADLRAKDDPDTAFARRGAPYTFNPEGLVKKLKEIREAAGARPVGWPGFEHGVGDPVEDEIQVPPGCRLIVVEGIYTLLRSGAWVGLEGLFDECWFLDTPLETSMERLYRRHQEAWGMSEEKARARADGNDRLNCEHITPGRGHADFLVKG